MKKAVELDPDEMRAEREDGEGGVLDFAGMMGVDIKQEKRPDGTQDTKVRIGEGKERELNMDVGLKGFFKDFVDDETMGNGMG